MKLNYFTRAGLFIISMFLFQSCEKSGNTCRTCHARYGGSTISSEKKCSTQEEQEFKTTYYYAEVTCE